jgi:hypothetical protein
MEAGGSQVQDQSWGKFGRLYLKNKYETATKHERGWILGGCSLSGRGLEARMQETLGNPE